MIRSFHAAFAAALLGGCAMSQPPATPAAVPARAQATPMDREATRLYEIGKAHLAAGRLGLAATSLQAARAANPGSLETLNALAATYDRMGRFDLADRYYGEALSLDGHDARTLNNFGYSQLMRGQPQRAESLFAIAQELDPTDPVVAANLALAEKDAAGTSAQPGAARAALPPAPALAPRPPQPAGTQAHAAAAPIVSPAAAQPPVIATAFAAPLDPDPATLAADPMQPVDEAELPPPVPSPAAAPVAAKAKPGEPGPVAAPSAAASRDVEPAPAVNEVASATEPRAGCALEVSNGAGRNRMAARFRAYLRGRGWSTQRLTNAATFANAETVVFYRDPARPTAERLAAELPGEVSLQASPDQACEVRVRLGRDLLSFDSTLIHQLAQGSIHGGAKREDRS